MPFTTSLIWDYFKKNVGKHYLLSIFYTLSQKVIAGNVGK